MSSPMPSSSPGPKNKTPIHIRPALPTDIPFLPSLELAADQIFLLTPVPEIACFTPPPVSWYAEFLAKGHLWVATTTSWTSISPSAATPPYEEIPTLPAVKSSETPNIGIETPIAFIEIMVFPNTPTYTTAYINQVSVLPAYQRQGIGRQLIVRVEQWASDQGFKAVDLATFDGVPWNREYYEKLGYSVLSKEENGEFWCEEGRCIRDVFEQRKEQLLGRCTRVGMRKVLGSREESMKSGDGGI